MGPRVRAWTRRDGLPEPDCTPPVRAAPAAADPTLRPNAAPAPARQHQKTLKPASNRDWHPTPGNKTAALTPRCAPRVNNGVPNPAPRRAIPGGAIPAGGGRCDSRCTVRNAGPGMAGRGHLPARGGSGHRPALPPRRRTGGRHRTSQPDVRPATGVPRPAPRAAYPHRPVRGSLARHGGGGCQPLAKHLDAAQGTRANAQALDPHRPRERIRV